MTMQYYDKPWETMVFYNFSTFEKLHRNDAFFSYYKNWYDIFHGKISSMSLQMLHFFLEKRVSINPNVVGLFEQKIQRCDVYSHGEPLSYEYLSFYKKMLKPKSLVSLLMSTSFFEKHPVLFHSFSVKEQMQAWEYSVYNHQMFYITDWVWSKDHWVYFITHSLTPEMRSHLETNGAYDIFSFIPSAISKILELNDFTKPHKQNKLIDIITFFEEYQYESIT